MSYHLKETIYKWFLFLRLNNNHGHFTSTWQRNYGNDRRSDNAQSFKMGQKFEDYARDYLFVKDYYDVLERTHNYTANNKDYVESSLKPDFKFRDRYTKKEFYVEAKFRTGDYQGKIMWCNQQQLSRYQQYNKERPVFILLGMGSDAKCPAYLSLIPLTHANIQGCFIL